MFCTGIFLKIKDGEGWDGWEGVDLTRGNVTAFDQWVSKKKPKTTNSNKVPKYSRCVTGDSVGWNSVTLSPCQTELELPLARFA